MYVLLKCYAETLQLLWHIIDRAMKRKEKNMRGVVVVLKDVEKKTICVRAHVFLCGHSVVSYGSFDMNCGNSFCSEGETRPEKAVTRNCL